MKYRHYPIIAVVFCIISFAASYVVGGFLSLPHQAPVRVPTERANIESVTIATPAGNALSGWFLPRRQRPAGILLLHGVKSNRGAMLGRALFLNDAGYSILLVDLQAHGESLGDQITFGYRESGDVEASFDYLKQRIAGKPVGIIGVSLGGASTLLSGVIRSADAFVFEAVYPTIEEAISNRLAIRFGPPGRILTTLLTWQFKFRLGISADWLRPINRIGQVQGPVLIIAGADDRHTRLQESRWMYNEAPIPKELWIIQGARHEDFHAFGPAEYEQRMLAFFGEYLKTG